jgi:hypothetical protein
MHLSTVFYVLGLASSAMASLNTSVEYQLRTQLKPHQRSKSRFDQLWLVASHTGAGLNDAVLYPNQTSGIKGFLNATSTTQANGKPFYNQLFDLGGDVPYGMSIKYESSYAAWEPVEINGGGGADGFFINSTGLQWNSYPGSSFGNEFGGWLVCDWWHGVPQLFAREA